MGENGYGLRRWRMLAAAMLASLLLAGCGGGGSDTAQAQPVVIPTGPGAPAATGVTRTDGLNWINYRRAQAGLPVLAQNALVDQAAQNHSDYQRLNDQITHTEEPGKPGFTGVTLGDRLRAAGYTFSGGFAYGEIISATTTNSGFYMAEELVTAIYHRFVMFEPKFKEIGTGAASVNGGYHYFTANLAATNGLGPGLGKNRVTVWPYDGQAQVPPNFMSDYEDPDPVPEANEVGYPVSVHADLDVVLATTSFTVRERGSGTALSAKLVNNGTATNPPSAVSIIPLAPLKGGTTYDVVFSGTTDGMPISRNWSFTTR